MLRRKLLLTLGGLTGMMLLMAVAALWPLQRVFQSLDHISTDAGEIMEHATTLNRTIGAVEVELYRLQAGHTVELDRLIDEAQLLDKIIAAVGKHYVSNEAEIAPVYERLRDREEQFRRRLSTLATVQDPKLARHHKAQAVVAASELRADILEISRYIQQHTQQEQAEVTADFRWLVIGIALAFLLLIDLAVILLLRATSMVLRPVDSLVAASRKLAQGDFSPRVSVDQHDEFDELARSFNYLAEELQQQEQRRLDTLRQVALTLNHELNNALAMIEMQLQLLRRYGRGEDQFEKPLRQIREGLERMAHVVESLKHIQRIVLTDYTSGLQMLDLTESTRDAAESGGRSNQPHEAT